MNMKGAFKFTLVGCVWSGWNGLMAFVSLKASTQFQEKVMVIIIYCEGCKIRGIKKFSPTFSCILEHVDPLFLFFKEGVQYSSEKKEKGRLGGGGCIIVQ